MKTIIDNFVDRVIEYGMYNEIDKIYVKNRVLALIGEEELIAFPMKMT